MTSWVYPTPPPLLLWNLQHRSRMLRKYYFNPKEWLYSGKNVCNRPFEPGRSLEARFFPRRPESGQVRSAVSSLENVTDWPSRKEVWGSSISWGRGTVGWHMCSQWHKQVVKRSWDKRRKQNLSYQETDGHLRKRFQLWSLNHTGPFRNTGDNKISTISLCSRDVAVSQKSRSLTKTQSQLRDRITKKNWRNGQRQVMVGMGVPLGWAGVRFYFHVSSICIFTCNQSAFRSISLAHGSGVFHMKCCLEEKLAYQRLKSGVEIGVMSKLQTEVL